MISVVRPWEGFVWGYEFLALICSGHDIAGVEGRSLLPGWDVILGVAVLWLHCWKVGALGWRVGRMVLSDGGGYLCLAITISCGSVSWGANDVRSRGASQVEAFYLW